MKRQLLLLLLWITLIATAAQAQVTIRGAVKSSRGESLPGVNVMIRGSFDGATTDHNGEFGFSTLKTGEQTLLLSFMGFKTKEVSLYLANDTILETLYMKEDATELDAVVITAGTFEAGDQRKSVTLRPLDIVTTPSAAGDIYGMLTSLPGAAIVGEDGRLFVRGGDAYESKTFIDGMMVRQPYASSVPDLPSRGRFSPFLFSGTTFSTGGYSAEYGQALSSALLLNINAFPEKTQTELSFMSVGLGARQTLKNDNGSLSLGVEYTNLKPYISIVPETFTWNQHPTDMSANLFGHRKTANNGLLKFFSNISASQSGLVYPDLSATPGSYQDIFLNNKNLYTQLTYMKDYNDWVLKMGVAFGYDADSISLKRFAVQEDYYSGQVRLGLSRTFSDHFSIKTGAEAAFTDYTFRYREYEGGVDFTGSFSEYLPAVFVEAESRPFHRLAVRTGLRHEYSSVIGKHVTAWRTSAAWLFNADWQASVAAGSFYQTPEEDILRYATQLHFEKASHYIALKNQLSPHFLFNSLSALSALVDIDKEKSKVFIQQLSEVYRYVLEHKGEELVPLEKEMDFVHSYLFLHEIRNSEGLKVDISISDVTGFVIPMSVQLLVENALKHNEASEKKPLTIKISKTNDNTIEVSNTYKPKTGIAGSGLGLHLLKKRCQFMFDRHVEILNENGVFKVMLPMAVTEDRI